MKMFDLKAPAPAPQHRRIKLFRFVPEDKQFLLILCILLCSIGSYFLISRYVLMSVQIQGVSMNPTLIDGDRYILYRCAYLWRSPKMGEIVVIRDPQDHGLSIKRIIALPDDVVEIRRDGVYVNQTKLVEPYLTAATVAWAYGDRRIPPIKLEKDSYFVLGDNRSRSYDSRMYGPVRRSEILGYISK